jgi:hypothetical protein
MLRLCDIAHARTLPASRWLCVKELGRQGHQQRLSAAPAGREHGISWSRKSYRATDNASPRFHGCSAAVGTRGAGGGSGGGALSSRHAAKYEPRTGGLFPQSQVFGQLTSGFEAVSDEVNPGISP